MNKRLESLRTSLLQKSSDELLEHVRQLRIDRRKVTPRVLKKKATAKGEASPGRAMEKLRAEVAALTPEQRAALLGE